LGSQVNHYIGSPKGIPAVVGVSNIATDAADTGQLLPFETATAKVVHDHDLMARIAKGPGEMMTHEPCSTRDDNSQTHNVTVDSILP
jgi:hypothetical protein